MTSTAETIHQLPLEQLAPSPFKRAPKTLTIAAAHYGVTAQASAPAESRAAKKGGAKKTKAAKAAEADDGNADDERDPNTADMFEGEAA
jgi:hypothetical protein